MLFCQEYLNFNLYLEENYSFSNFKEDFYKTYGIQENLNKKFNEFKKDTFHFLLLHRDLTENIYKRFLNKK